jgi:hypothetical protein
MGFDDVITYVESNYTKYNSLKELDTYLASKGSFIHTKALLEFFSSNTTFTKITRYFAIKSILT